MSSDQRVIFFVEPYVVRSGVEDFRTPFEIFRDIAAMLAVGGNVATAIVCNSALASRAPASVRCYTPSEFGIDESMSADWQANWTSMLAGRDVGNWGAFYRRTLEDFRPTLAYLWNKNSLFQRACADANVPNITLEYGGVRTASGFRISIDPDGFGPDSALANHQSEQRDDLSAAGWQWASAHVYRDALLMRAPQVALRREAAQALRVCVLLQKEDDVNFLIWPAFSDMREFVDRVLGELTKIADVEITVRRHPGGLHDYSSHIAERFPKVHLDRSGFDFLQQVLGFDAVITLNSAGGFEAMLCGVPAMTFSQGFYRCAFTPPAGTMGIDRFIELVRKNEFWTEQKRRDVGCFVYRLVKHYSIPIELLRDPEFHRALIDALAGMGQNDVRNWFASDPPRLAEIVRTRLAAAEALEISTLRAQNHSRLLELHQLAAQITALAAQIPSLAAHITALEEDNHLKNQAFAAMTQANSVRDQAIANLADTLARMTAQNISRDDAIAQISRLLEEFTTQNQSKDAAIAHAAKVLEEITRQNRDRDEAIAHINQTLAEMTRQNEARDSAIQTLSERRRWRVLGR